MSSTYSPHNFYIPVMGTGFTIDTPLAVAKYGISSVISLVDDVLIEQIRKFWCNKLAEPYKEITNADPDHRAKRITAYLNLLQRQIRKQIEQVKTALFEPNSEITNYFELLPDGQLKQKYQTMLTESDNKIKTQLQSKLRQAVTAGSIDVNIMTKLDFPHYSNGEQLPYERYDGAAALRGYANSDLSSTIVFSAGFNPHLYNYLATFPDFFPNENNELKKKICLKVSDYRSAAIQGKYLAKHGLWISEYRIESPLNCGGHAFVNDGQLLGPILEEFKQRKDELVATLYGIYTSALKSIKKFCTDLPKKVRITAQGGIGTAAEHDFLLTHYEINAAGWGTPFLLVPEVTNVDAVNLQKLLAAEPETVALSSSSPLGIPFWNLKNSVSEEARCARIAQGTPGSVCVKGYAKFNQEFTEKPLCLASKEYQTRKLADLNKSNLKPLELAAVKDEVLSRSCICHDLAAGATIKNNLDFKATGAICPGPNIVNFKNIATLKEMVNHIYGRCSLLSTNNRAHIFIREIQLQISYLLNEIKKSSLGLPSRSQQKIEEAKKNLLEGLTYYQNLSKQIFKEQQDKFLIVLNELKKKVLSIGVAT